MKDLMLKEHFWMWLWSQNWIVETASNYIFQKLTIETLEQGVKYVQS